MTAKIILLLAAMVTVESSNNPNPPGGDKNSPGGPSIGPLQIQRAYWQDAKMPDGSYEDCHKLPYAKRVVLRYWRRYEPDALKAENLEILARLHNGGPNWRKYPATETYWRRVKQELQARGAKP